MSEFSIETIDKVYLMLGAACNFKCRHCYQTDVEMPRLRKTICDDVWFFLQRIAHHGKRLVFWGGEPLLYWPLIRETVLRMGDDSFQYWIMSNGSLLTDEIVDFLNVHGIAFSVSNDGPETSRVRGVNVLENPDFVSRFKRINRKCVGAVTHAYNIDPHALVDYVWSKVGFVPIYYQYILECTFAMDKDLYGYDFEAFRQNVRRCCNEYSEDKRNGDDKTPARYFMARGFGELSRYRERKKRGLPEEWYPDCMPMRREMNVDILGVVHACHNRFSPIGRCLDSYETLLKNSDRYFLEAITKKTECERCSVNYLCRHGCPLNPISEGQRECCKAEVIYWEEVVRQANKNSGAVKGATLSDDFDDVGTVGAR